MTRTGLSRSQMATAAGVDPSAFNKLLNGESREFKAEDADALLQDLQTRRLLADAEEIGVWRKWLHVSAMVAFADYKAIAVRLRRIDDPTERLLALKEYIGQQFRAWAETYERTGGVFPAAAPLIPLAAEQLRDRLKWVRVPEGFELRELNADEYMLTRNWVAGTPDFGPDVEVTRPEPGRYIIRRKGAPPRVPAEPRERPPGPVRDRIPEKRTARYIEPELIRIPAGVFWMGSDDTDKEAYSDEKPRHRVHVSEFWIARYPATCEMYRRFLLDNPLHKEPSGWKGRNFPNGKGNHPVVNVSWQDADDYCKWLSRITGQTYKMPSEAQWEKAARGTDGRKYPWGNEWDAKKCNTRDGGPGTTTPVGAYSAAGGDSPYGVADMAGNVWEWCADWYDEKEYSRRKDKEVKDPLGPAKGSLHPLRGGAWGNLPVDARCAFRNWGVPVIRTGYIGFRVVAASPVSRS
jgi:formylglycine-generating enzyme required for sulfatase activity